jgi:sulfopyruvate decarboxylase alpha subunit
VPWEAEVISAFKQRGIDVVAYLPDTALSGLIESVESDEYFETVRIAREEEAVGVLSGTWLGGRRGALICQSSGLANTFNALGSLTKAARIPFVGVVTHRGGLGDHNLAHRPAEYPMPDLLDTIGIRNHRLDDDSDVERRVSMASKSAFSMEEPFIMLLSRTLTGDAA